MASGEQRIVLRPSCVTCGAAIQFDVTDYEQTTTMSLRIKCPNEHYNEFAIRGRVILSHVGFGNVSDIDSYLDVPEHIKSLIKESYVCVNENLPIAGIGVVRRSLDELLYQLGFTQRNLGDKVTALGVRFNNDVNFLQTYPTINRRLSIFRTISDLGGFYLHAQRTSVFNIATSEVSSYLYVVEAGIKEVWPRRTP